MDGRQPEGLIAERLRINTVFIHTNSGYKV